MRECSALALNKLKAVEIDEPVKRDLFARLVLRLVQDDNAIVRGYASEIVTSRWTSGATLNDRKGVEAILIDVGPLRLDRESAEFSRSIIVLYRLV